ncbi:MAG: DUF1015 domain-containing protein [Desulfobacterales bacterium]|nr:DUF1015 domain-containing protein [Desulfobacterales bacterium]
MAEIIPFHGFRYNDHQINDLSKVVAPPYDVISPKHQDELYERHPKNIVRLILAKQYPDDTKTQNRYTRAAHDLHSWIADGTLLRDEKPAFYINTVEFTVHNKSYTRYGIIGLARLEPFDKKIILPHEMTFSKVKSDRLELITQCKANLSPIFSIYSDEHNLLTTFKNAIQNKQPVLDVEDDYQVRHQLWKVTDTDILNSITHSFQNQRLYIADGHHRYETALNYRNLLLKTEPNLADNHPSNYVLMYLCSMEDPGLCILPSHRILKAINPAAIASFEQNAQSFFTVESIPMAKPEILREMIAQKLEMDSHRIKIGVVFHKHLKAYILTLKPDAVQAAMGSNISPLLQQLDVSILTFLVLGKLFDISPKQLDDENVIKYSSNTLEALQYVDEQDSSAVFILNPTRVSQVRDIALNGEIMPRKTTYFYPKVMSGLVINKL